MGSMFWNRTEMPSITLFSCSLLAAMFSDATTILNTPKQRGPIPGIHFSEFYTDDNMLVFGDYYSKKYNLITSTITYGKSSCFESNAIRINLND